MSSSICGRMFQNSRILSSFGGSGPSTLKYTTTARKRAVQPMSAGNIISDTAKREQGTEKGSDSAQMQSQATKERNFQQAAQEVAGKMQTSPEAVTSEDAAHLKSREARATGVAQPPKDSISAEAQRLAANEGATKHSNQGDMNPDVQSAVERKENFEQVAADLAPKMETNPEKVTQEEANLLHSREHRAFGETAKGGIASQAQSLASENEKKGTM